MSDSEFLKYQDANNDGLIDECEELIEVKETPACPPCLPNPTAIVPNWRNRRVDEPFFNEKN